MQFGGGSFSGDSLGSILVDPGAIVDPTSLRPILTEINGVDARETIVMDSLMIQDTVGQPVTCNFTMINPNAPPIVGDTVRVFFHAQLIFAGTIDRVTKSSPDLTTFQYQVDCLDWSQTLIRRKLRRNFINAPIQNILDSILDNELIGETLTIGIIDSRATLPLVDSRSGKVFDVLRDMAGATGQTFYVDFDQSIQMRSTTLSAAPLVFNESNVLLEGMGSTVDRETYRNVQTVIVTGTPPAGKDALVTTQRRINADQIAARAAIEGGAGIYEEIEEITHPTSNDGVEIALLGISYARLRLSTSGTPRITVRCQVRGYGFRAGQIATVDLPTFGVVGTYVVQRVSIRERDGTHLFHDIELTSSSLQQRAYESWLSVVKGAKVTVQVPSSITNNLQIFNTPGTFTWTVPAGVTTVELTCIGASSGGGGGARITGIVHGANLGHVYQGGAAPDIIGANGGTGGRSGKAISVIDVVAGQEITLIVGAATSVPGLNDSMVHSQTLTTGQTRTTAATDGGAASSSRAIYQGVTVAQGDSGTGGKKGVASEYYDGFSIFFTTTNGVVGTDGGGIGDAVSVGGGLAGGAKGTGIPYVGPGSQDGRVEVRW